MAKNILIIDDDRLVVKSLARLLETEGYLVGTAENAKEALVLVEQKNFDLIISDIRMPGINGIEMVSVLNNNLKNKQKDNIPVIFITGYTDEAKFNEAKNLGVADFLYKPFDKETFLQAVVNALEDS